MLKPTLVGSASCVPRSGVGLFAQSSLEASFGISLACLLGGAGFSEFVGQVHPRHYKGGEEKKHKHWCHNRWRRWLRVVAPQRHAADPFWVNCCTGQTIIWHTDVYKSNKKSLARFFVSSITLIQLHSCTSTTCTCSCLAGWASASNRKNHSRDTYENVDNPFNHWPASE